MSSIKRVPSPACAPEELAFYDWLEAGLKRPVSAARQDRLKEVAQQYGADIHQGIVKSIDRDARPVIMYALLSWCSDCVPADARPAENLGAALRSIRDAAQQDRELSRALRTFYFRYSDPDERGEHLGAVGHGKNLPIAIRPIEADRPSYMIRAVAAHEPPDASQIADRLLEKVGSTWKLYSLPGHQPIDLFDLAQPTLESMQRTLSGMLTDPHAKDLSSAVDRALEVRKQDNTAFWQGVKEAILKSLAPNSAPQSMMGRARNGLIREVLEEAGHLEKS